MTPACRRRIGAVLMAGAVVWPLGALAQQVAQQAPTSAPSGAAQAQPKPSPKKKEAAQPKADPTAAQSNVEAGVAALGQGRNDAAVASLTSAISASSLPPAQSARALYYRGVAYRRQSKPAQAIADLTNALWIKNGLTEEQRVDALQQRSAAYRDAGLPEQGAPPPAGAAPSGQAAAKTKAGAPSTLFTAVAPQPASSPSGSTTGSFFSSILGSANAPSQSQPQTTSSTEPPKPSGTVQRSRLPLPTGFEATDNELPVFYQGPARTPPALPQPTAAAKPWDAAIEVKVPRPKTSQSAAAQTANASALKTGSTAAGVIRVQVAAVRSPQEAQGVASKLQAGYARELGGRAPVVDQLTVGNQATIYRVQVGPFASARDAEPLCARLKGDGLDCRLLSQ